MSHVPVQHSVYFYANLRIHRILNNSRFRVKTKTTRSAVGIFHLDSLSSRCTAMSRWHREDCRAPAVVLINLQPTCESCGGVFCLENTIALQQCGQRSFEKLPLDEIQGHLNLWWPPSVNYINGQQHAQRNNDMCEPSQNQTQEDDRTMPQLETTSYSTKDKIYGKPLPQGSFRLICMQATTELSEPVHIELETYRHSHCPSYETVSYTWGGEQGDTSPCRPIFIGPYWDVLLQTENCWQLLRYARPTRGIRLLWVDAICINQDNDEERAIQVAMMAQIYSDCERTLVYLGPEIVKWHPEHLRERKGLHELAGAGQSGNYSQAEDHRKLLESRKYFTRLWIVQEAVLSPKLIIPIDNVTYWADRRTDSKLQKTSGEAWDWWNNKVPWAKSIGQQEFPVQNASEALLLTTQNQSSDPRDRLFGLLALLGSYNTTSPPFRANYTLSNQHIWIGFFAHAISRDGAFWVLNNASGHKAMGSVPSWAPDWNLHSMWSGFRRRVRSKTVERTFFQQVEQDNEDKSHIAFEDEVSPLDRRQDISVDAASGALIGVRAMRLFTFVNKPKTGGHSSSGDYFYFSVENNSYFNLFSSERLDDIVQPLKDHLYLLKTGSEETYLVLREHRPTTLKAWDWSSFLLDHGPTLGARRCRLIASCTCLPNPWGGIKWSNRGNRNLQGYISDLREELSFRLGGEVLLVPLSRDRWDLLPLYWVMDGGSLLSTECSDGYLPEAYLACLPGRYHKRVDQSYVTLTSTDDSDATIQEMNDWLVSAYVLWSGHGSIQLEEYIEWEWSIDNTRWTKFADWDYKVNSVYREEPPPRFTLDFEDYGEEKRAGGTWKFNFIPVSQDSGTAAGAVLDHGTKITGGDDTTFLHMVNLHAAGAILDHGIKITEGDGTVRLRAPVQSISECLQARPCRSRRHIRLLHRNLHLLAEGMGLRSLEEIQNVLFDTSRDWSHFRFQARGISRGSVIEFSTEIQLIDIF